ncbi:hypothetical protein TSUD_144640 [Trifolium subterraneum]|uniref:TF-B3 domain-containing protein n=1 Tax=Trifolium subterraneum TaxID=3900 RepID=A0A2Z6N943_TRISU|nr:hypothetical protein TSUD_144640 [Trifolium subterraneum]
MTHLTPVFPNIERDSLSIVKTSDQKYAEIETSFGKRHRGETYGNWQVIKNDTDYHKLRFNNDYENPLILTQGWNKFKEFHNLPDNVEVMLSFHGNNTFQVDVIKELKGRAEIPSFHSRSLHPTRTSVFDFSLTPNNVDVPQFVVDFDFA